MGRVDYFHDPAAPAANSLVVGTSAVVTDGEGRILLHRRADSGNWALPGGAMELGETLAGCVIRIQDFLSGQAAVLRLESELASPALPGVRHYGTCRHHDGSRARDSAI